MVIKSITRFWYNDMSKTEIELCIVRLWCLCRLSLSTQCTGEIESKCSQYYFYYSTESYVVIIINNIEYRSTEWVRRFFMYRIHPLEHWIVPRVGITHHTISLIAHGHMRALYTCVWVCNNKIKGEIKRQWCAVRRIHTFIMKRTSHVHETKAIPTEFLLRRFLTFFSLQRISRMQQQIEFLLIVSIKTVFHVSHAFAIVHSKAPDCARLNFLWLF